VPNLTVGQWFARLEARRREQVRQIDAAKWWKYVDNEQPSTYLARVLHEQGNRFPELRVNWSELALSSVDERLSVRYFQVEGESGPDETLGRIWTENGLDALQSEAHAAAMVARTVYLMAGPGPGDIPLVTIEYPDQVAVEVDPVTRQEVAALKVWKSDPELAAADMAELFLPGRSVVFENGKPTLERPITWTEALAGYPNLPRVPVVVMHHYPRRGEGRSALTSIMPLHDAVNQTATNLMAGIEHHSLPRRWAVGLSEDDFLDENGRPLAAWQIATGAVWMVGADQDAAATGNAEPVRVGQFTPSDLRGLLEAVKLWAGLAASVYGLPEHYMILSSADNPASADAIKSGESRLVRRTERCQVWFGPGGWSRLARLIRALMQQDPSKRVTTQWVDASTPTKAAQADATVKLVGGRIIDAEQGQEDLGYTETQISNMRQRALTPASAVSGIVDGLRALDLPTPGSISSAALPRS
jgi:hypothetical protein